jgi:uncharacterized protein YjbI with pentapeptide repeats
MNRTELTERMHAVLDGAATPEQARELERLLAGDTAAQLEFDGWRSVFQTLEHMPRASPPEGLVAAVSAAMAHRPAPLRTSHQLFTRPGVLEHRHLAGRSASSRIRATFRRLRRSETLEETEVMSEQKNMSFRNRKLWAGGAVAVLIVGVAIFTFDYPPKGGDVVATIVPAERYQAPQAGAEAIKLGDQSIAQLMQSDAFDRMIKDPEMQSLAKEANMRALAELLAANSQLSQTMLGNIGATRAAVEHAALSQTVLADVEASRQTLAAIDAQQTAAADSELARSMRQNVEASRAILAGVDASHAALSHAQLANAIVANYEASKLLLSTAANSAALDNAAAMRMRKDADASRAVLQGAQADKAAQ